MKYFACITYTIGSIVTFSMWLYTVTKYKNSLKHLDAYIVLFIPLILLVSAIIFAVNIE
jgi:hypothetical protein